MPPRRRHLRPYKWLHRARCLQSEEDFHFMQDLIDVDPRSLVRHQNIEELGSNGPPLMAAYFKKHYLCMQFLLQRSAKPEGLNLERYTTMNYALHDDDFQAVEMLLNYGANPNYNPGCGSYLGWASDLKVFGLLLQYGANPDDYLQYSYERNAFHHSSLACALKDGDIEKAKLLLLHGAITDYSGIQQIPLSGRYINAFPHCIISIPQLRREKKKSIELQKRLFYTLQQFGVSLYQRDKLGLTAYDVVKFRAIGDMESQELLQFLTELLSDPLSLSSLARIAILQIYKRDYLMQIIKMEKCRIIPKTIFTFLNYSDV